MPYVGSQLLRKNNALFALLDQLDVKLSQYLVADDAARDAIPDYIRMTGCECRVLDSAEAGGGEAIYQLESDLSTWTIKVLTDYIPISEKGVASGVATLDAQGFIQSTQIRNLFIQDSYIVAQEADALALTTITGNVVVMTDAPDAGRVILKLNNADPALISDFAELTSAISVASFKAGEDGTPQTGAVSFTLSSLLADTSDFTSFNSQVADSPSVAGNTSAISTLQSDITAINQAISDIKDAIAAVGTGITVHNQTLTYAIDRYVWANGRVYKSISAVPADTLITNTTYWDVFGGYPEDVLVDGDVEATLTGTVGKLPDSNAVKTYVDDLLPGVGVPGGALGSIQTNLDDQVFDGFGNWNGQRMQIDFEDAVTDDVKELFSLKRTSSSTLGWIEAGTDSLPNGTRLHSALVFDPGDGEKMWRIGGDNATIKTRKVYWSTDGITWTEAGTDALPVAVTKHASVVFDSKMWVIGGETLSGDTRKVYWSTDGITWTEAGTDALLVATRHHTAVVFDSKMWVIGGYVTGTGPVRKVYWSTDGITWTKAGTDALPIATYTHSSVVFDSKMWVIGGYTADYTRKVYWSTDGITWTEAGADALPVATRYHASVVYDSKMWVICGVIPSIATQKVFFSANGITWTELGTDSFPVATSFHVAVVFNSKMWVIGGFTTIYTLKVYSYSSALLTGFGANDSVYLEDNLGITIEVLKRLVKWNNSNNSEYAVQVLLNGVLTEIVSLVGDHIKLNGFAQLKEIADPSGSPATGYGRLWLSSDTSKLRFQDDAGNKFDIDMTAV